MEPGVCRAARREGVWREGERWAVGRPAAGSLLVGEGGRGGGGGGARAAGGGAGACMVFGSAARAKLEAELQRGEQVASAAVVAQLRVAYDAVLRRDGAGGGALAGKFHYAYALLHSSSRGNVRRGMELLGELRVMMRGEIETRERGASFSCLGPRDEAFQAPRQPRAAAPRERQEHVQGGSVRRKLGEDEPEYVFVAGADEQQEESKTEDPEESKAPEGKVGAVAQDVESDLDSGCLQAHGGDKPIPASAPAPASSLAVGLGLPSFEGHEARLMGLCLFYLAVGEYRLGEYRQGIARCDELLREEPEHARALALRHLCFVSMVSRGAVGLLLTVGVAIPAAYLLNKNGGVSAAVLL